MVCRLYMNYILVLIYLRKVFNLSWLFILAPRLSQVENMLISEHSAEGSFHSTGCYFPIV